MVYIAHFGRRQGAMHHRLSPSVSNLAQNDWPGHVIVSMTEAEMKIGSV
jgi:hypothetical protein